MQIKATMRYHFTPVRIAIINKTANNMCCQGCEKGEPFCSVGGNADWCSHCGKQYGITQKVKNGSAFWPNDSTSGNISKGT